MAVVVGAILILVFGGGSSSAIPVGRYETVRPMNMDIKVAKDGEIQAINNIDIVCRVEGQTTITWVVKEGTTVHKGDTLMLLDSSAIKQRLEDAQLDLQKAEADMAAANENVEIQKDTNAANLQGAEVALTLAQLDLKQYTDGTYPQLVENAQRAKQMAEIALNNREEDLKQTRSLFAKGFVTAADVKKSELDVLTAKNDLAANTTDLEVLTTYTHEKDLASKNNTLAQAERGLARVKRSNASNLAWKVADQQAKQQQFVVHQRRVQKLQEQLVACTIKAPADGMVIYASTFDRSQQTPIQEGTQVRERQLLLRLPDTSAMKAVLRIQEAQVPKLQDGQRATVRVVGIPDPIGATLTHISVLADNSQRWWNPDLREYPVDLTLDQSPPELKPGMGVQAEIYVRTLRNVLAVPLTCVYAAGSNTFVFTRGAEDRPVPREVTIGESNETHAQITSGLDVGDQVLVLQIGQGQQLLAAAGIKVQGTVDRGPTDATTQPTTRPEDMLMPPIPPNAPDPTLSDRPASPTTRPVASVLP